jgi:hypothetical protein
LGHPGTGIVEQDVEDIVGVVENAAADGEVAAEVEGCGCYVYTWE